jgi:hypothetical protein
MYLIDGRLSFVSTVGFGFGDPFDLKELSCVWCREACIRGDFFDERNLVSLPLIFSNFCSRLASEPLFSKGLGLVSDLMFLVEPPGFSRNLFEFCMF